MRHLILALLLSLGMSAAAGPAMGGDAFLSTIEDLPLMQGLRENDNAAVFFETAGGRLAEAEARGPAAASAVADFYADVLPQLGWKPDGAGAYLRDGERLTLDIAADGSGGTTVRFSLGPARP